MAFAPLGLTRTFPNVATLSWRAASMRAACTAEANGNIGSRRSTSRVVPAWLASPPKGEVPSAVRPDRRGDGHRPPQILQRPALLDMKLHIHTDTVGERVIGTEVIRTATRVRRASARGFRRCRAGEVRAARSAHRAQP